MNEFKSFKFLVPGVLSQKFAKEVGGLSIVIPAEAGIQRFFEVLDSGSRQLQPEADPSQPAADPPVEDFGGIASLAGMTERIM
jgi:hypothetical protein